MRRKTAGVQIAAELSLQRVGHDPERVIRLLEPLVTDARRARLLDVIGRRLASVAVVLDAPYDPHNGAAVVRSCDAFGIQQLHVVERRGTPFAVASTVARGAEKWVDVVRHTQAASLLAWASRAEMPLIAAHPGGDLLPEQLLDMPRLAVVLGNERDGIGPPILSRCASGVRVPMRGFAESINVSVTAAILLQAATRGRPGDLDPPTRRRLYARGLYLSVPHAEEVLAAG